MRDKLELKEAKIIDLEKKIVFLDEKTKQISYQVQEKDQMIKNSQQTMESNI